MKTDLNRSAFIGFVGADAKQHKDANGPVTFSIATTARWVDDQGEECSRTDWHELTVYSNLRKYAVSLKKGDRVYVEAELRNNHYDKTVGGETIKIYGTRLVAQEIERVYTKTVAEPKEPTDFPYGEPAQKEHAKPPAEPKQRKK